METYKIILAVIAILLILIVKYIRINHYKEVIRISEIENSLKEEKIKDLERNLRELYKELKNTNTELHDAHRIINSNNLKNT